MATKIWINIGFLSDSTKLLTWTIVVFSYDRWGSLYGLFIKSFHYKAYIKHATQFSAAQTSPALRPIATILDLNPGWQSDLVGSGYTKNVLREYTFHIVVFDSEHIYLDICLGQWFSRSQMIKIFVWEFSNLAWRVSQSQNGNPILSANEMIADDRITCIW